MQTEIPQGWTWSRIGDHFKRITRKNKAGVRRVLTASGEHGLIDQEEYFNKRVAAKNVDGYFHLQRGEFAYNRSAMNGYPFGATKRLDRYDDGVLSTLYLCFGLRPGAGVMSDYAVQLFDSDLLHSELQPIVRVGARAHGLLNVTPSDFMEVALPLPPLREQKKIAAILASVDEAIQATEAVIEQTRRVKEGLLQDLLTRGIGHSRFKQTEIGEIPESWDAVPCASLSRQISVGIVVKPTQYYAEQGVKCWRSANIGPGFVRDEDWVYIRPEANEELSKSRLDTGDIVVIRTGYPGTACVVPPSLDQTNCVDVLFIRPAHETVLSDFLCWFINSDTGKQQVLAGQGGGAQQHFNVKELKRMVISLPSLEEQQQIVDHLSKVQATEQSEEAKLAALHQVKAGLLQDLLSGAVRVTA